MVVESEYLSVGNDLEASSSQTIPRTTIIECLKYAVSGAFPPGNKNGQAFVHDPRSIGLSQVKANVKLRFTSRAGKTMVVARTMEVNQQKSKLSFKQLDGVLRYSDDDGTRHSLSHKCSELDREVCGGVGGCAVSSMQMMCLSLVSCRSSSASAKRSSSM